MLIYKNSLDDLVLPEYGRNIQNMTAHCLTIEDRAERTRCARSIVDAMSILFPPKGEDKYAHRRKLWDHLYVLSGFRLDVDLPFELTRPEEFDKSPEAVTLPAKQIKRRQYGHIIEAMVDKATAMPAGEERDRLIELLANQMKKCLMAVSPDGVEDVRVFKDLYEMTDGAIYIDPQDLRLQQYQIIVPPKSKKKRKR